MRGRSCALYGARKGSGCARLDDGRSQLERSRTSRRIVRGRAGQGRAGHDRPEAFRRKTPLAINFCDPNICTVGARWNELDPDTSAVGEHITPSVIGQGLVPFPALFRRLRQASVAEIASVPGIGPNTAAKLKEKRPPTASARRRSAIASPSSPARCWVER